MVTATAPGKLVLLGEYAVLAGAPALVTAVDRRARVELRPRGSGSGFIVTAPQLGIASTPVRLGAAAAAGDRLQIVRAVIEEVAAVCAEWQVALPDAELWIDTSAFFAGDDKLGLGSSAAVAVALFGGLLELAGVSSLSMNDREQIFHRVLAAHRRAQGGKGSGVDVAASTFGGVLEYTMDESPRQVRWPDELVFLPVWSGASASTPELVARVDWAVRNTESAHDLILQMKGLAADGARAVTAGDTDVLAATLDTYHDAMAALGDEAGVALVTPAHAAIARVVRGAGGAYKPSGAGGGDLGLAFCKSAAVCDKVRSALSDGGFAAVPMAPSVAGLEVSR